MTQNRIESATEQPTVPAILPSWLAVFRPCFTTPVWNHILVLVGGAVLAPGKRTVAQRRGGDWHRRYHRAALGRQDQGTRHLSRRGAFVARPLCQDQRFALAVAGGDVADPVRRPAVGVAIPDCAGAVGALERGAGEAAQGPDRLGEAGDTANQTLAAGSPPGCRRGQWFPGIGTHRRSAPIRLSDHQVASRRQFVRAGTQTPKGSNGTARTERQTPAQTQRVLADRKTVWTS